MAIVGVVVDGVDELTKPGGGTGSILLVVSGVKLLLSVVLLPLSLLLLVAGGDIDVNNMNFDKVSKLSQVFAISSWSARLLFFCILLSLFIEFKFEFGGLPVKTISSAAHGCKAGAMRNKLGSSRSKESPTFSIGSTFVVNKNGTLVDGATR